METAIDYVAKYIATHCSNFLKQSNYQFLVKHFPKYEQQGIKAKLRVKSRHGNHIDDTVISVLLQETFEERVSSTAIVCSTIYNKQSGFYYVFPHGSFRFLYSKHWNLTSDKHLSILRRSMLQLNTLSIGEKFLKLNLSDEALDQAFDINSDVIVWGCKRFTILSTDAITPPELKTKIQNYERNMG